MFRIVWKIPPIYCSILFQPHYGFDTHLVKWTYSKPEKKYRKSWSERNNNFMSCILRFRFGHNLFQFPNVFSLQIVFYELQPFVNQGTILICIMFVECPESVQRRRWIWVFGFFNHTPICNISFDFAFIQSELYSIGNCFVNLICFLLI